MATEATLPLPARASGARNSFTFNHIFQFLWPKEMFGLLLIRLCIFCCCCSTNVYLRTCCIASVLCFLHEISHFWAMNSDWLANLPALELLFSSLPMMQEEPLLLSRANLPTCWLDPMPAVMPWDGSPLVLSFIPSQTFDFFCLLCIAVFLNIFLYCKC